MTFEELLAQFAEAVGQGGVVSTAAEYAPQSGVPLPDAGLGPVTDTTRAGRPNAMLSMPQPSTAQRFGNAVLDYGPMPAQLATELTGVPSMVRGGERIGQAALDGDPLGLVAGGAEAALGMVPGGAATRTGREMLAPLVSTVPRAMATGTVAMAPEAVFAARGAKRQAEAKAQSAQPDGMDAMREAVKGDPRLEALLAQWAEKNRQGSADVPGVKDRASGDQVRSDARAEAKRLWNDLLSGVEEKRKANAPFRERYPGAAEAIGYTAAGLGAAIPFANTVKTRLARSMIENPRINRAADTLEAAFNNMKTPTAKLAGMQDQLARRVGAYEASTSKAANAMNVGKNVGLASLLAFEGASVPEQVDALAFAPGHPVREAARAELTNEDYYKNRIPAAVVSGILTGGGGMKLGTTATPGGAPRDMSRAHELIQRGSPESLARIRNLEEYRTLSRNSGAGLPDGPEPPRDPLGSIPQGPPANSQRRLLHQEPSPQASQGPPPNNGPYPPSGRRKPRQSPSNLRPETKNKILENLASGKVPNSMSPAHREYVSYLNDLSARLGLSIEEMNEMIKSGAKKGPWAIPLAAGVTAYSTRGDE